MQIQIPTDLDLHCLLRQVMSFSAREGVFVNKLEKFQYILVVKYASAGAMKQLLEYNTNITSFSPRIYCSLLYIFIIFSN